VIFDVEEAQLEVLDRFEGVGYGYRRDEIMISLEGTKSRVCVYVAEADYLDEALVPFDWYHQLVVAGAEQNALASEYIAGLQAVPFRKDPDPNRKSRLEALAALQHRERSKRRT
jgi:gamma-glutamylcyclotransferase